MNPYDKARELKRALEASQEFKNYKAALESLEADTATKAMVDDFREKQFDLQRRELLGEELSQEETDKIQELASILSMNKLAAEYLGAEYNYARLMQEISEILAEIME